MFKRKFTAVLTALIFILSAFSIPITSRAEGSKTVKFFMQFYGDSSVVYGIPMEYTASDENNGTLIVKQPCRAGADYNFSNAYNYNKI